MSAFVFSQTDTNYQKVYFKDEITIDNFVYSETDDELLKYWKDSQLIYWQDDLINAYYKDGDAAKMIMLGDSYVPTYGYRFREEISKRYGFGGGYFILRDVQYTYGGNWVELNNWTNVQDNTDAYTIVGRATGSTTDEAVIYCANKQWNIVRVHYRKFVGGGDFTVQVNYDGVPVSVSTNAADADGWYYKDFGDVMYEYGTDTVIITKDGTDSVRLYGVYLSFDEYRNGLPEPFQFHALTNGGCQMSAFYDGKDSLTAVTFLDSLDASLCVNIFLDDSTSVEDNATDLIDYLTSWKSDMSHLFLTPHVEEDFYYSEGEEKIYFNAAMDKEAGIINIHNHMSDDTAKYNELGYLSDGVHLSGNGRHLPYFYLTQLLPQTNFIAELNVGSLEGVMNIPNDEQMNVSIGNEAGINMTTGYENTFIGTRAGRANLAGYRNTFVGYQSGVLNTNGIYNTAVGQQSLYQNTVGDYNVMIGMQSGYLTTGSNNIMIGYQCGRANTSSGNNTYVGHQAGRSATGSGNIFIGYQAAYNETKSNRLYIHNTNADSTSALIYGMLADSCVMINDLLVLPPRAFPPTDPAPTDGMIYVNSTTNHIYCYINGAWRQLDN